MILLQFTQKLLDFQGHYHIEGGQRFIQQDNRGTGYDKTEHLDLVFHSMGISFNQLVSVLLIHFYHIEIFVDGLFRSSLPLMDIHIKRMNS